MHYSFSLSRDEVQTIAKQGYNVIPIYRDFVYDLDSPVSLYLKSGAWKKSYSFLLESVVGGESRGQYSYIGIESEKILIGKDGIFSIKYATGTTSSLTALDPLNALREAIAQHHLYESDELAGFYAGIIGFCTYDMIHYYESTSVNKNKSDPLDIFDIMFVFPKLLIWLDHTRGVVKIIANIFLPLDSLPSDKFLQYKYDEATESIAGLSDTLTSDVFLQEYLNLGLPWEQYSPSDKQGDRDQSISDTMDWKVNMTSSEYANMIHKAKEYIYGGDIFQVVLSKRYSGEYKHDPFWLYRALRVTNPSPYMFYLNFDPHCVVIGSSPEILVKKVSNKVIIRPIAGTIQRGKNSKEDISLEEKLLQDPKEQAEHIMLVDLGRNDLGKVATYGSVKVDEYMQIDKYSHVMHIVSNVVGELKPGQDVLDCLRATFPAGTVSGAPKVRAMQIIDELEKETRGLYSGVIGYINFNHDMDTAIALRTMIVKEQVLYLQAGGGIVADSSITGEEQEIDNKLRALFKAIDLLYKGM